MDTFAEIMAMVHRPRVMVLDEVDFNLHPHWLHPDCTIIGVYSPDYEGSK